MLTRGYTTTPLQIFWELLLYSQIIFRSMKEADDTLNGLRLFLKRFICFLKFILYCKVILNCGSELDCQSLWYCRANSFLIPGAQQFMVGPIITIFIIWISQSGVIYFMAFSFFFNQRDIWITCRHMYHNLLWYRGSLSFYSTSPNAAFYSLSCLFQVKYWSRTMVSYCCHGNKAHWCL